MYKTSEQQTKASMKTKHNKTKKDRKLQIPYALRQILVKSVECPDCKRYGQILEDRKSGKTVCTRCGLVLNPQFISEETEWRTFENDDKSGPDPNRCGSAANIYLSSICGLETQIGTIGSSQTSLSNVQRKVMNESSMDRKLKRGILDIQNYGERLNLTKDVKNFTCELFKELLTRRELYGKRGINIITACVYISCKKCNCNRSLEGLCNEFIVDKKVIKKILSIIHGLYASNKITLPILRRGRGYIYKTTAEILAVKFGWQLSLNRHSIKNLQIICRKIVSYHILDGKKPETIAAAAIYLTCIVNGDETQRRGFKEISVIARISEHTIKRTFREYLFLRIKTLLPQGYGDSDAINEVLANHK